MEFGRQGYVKNFIQKVTLGFLLAVTLFVGSAQQTHAQWVTSDPTALSADVMKTATAEVKSATDKTLTTVLTTIGINMLNYVATQTAQSTAIWIANGAAGKHPLFNRQTISEIGKSVSATVTNQYLDKIIPGSKMLAALGIDSNNPSTTGLLRKLLASSYVPASLTEDGRIDGSSLGRNFGSYVGSLGSTFGNLPPETMTAKILTDTINATSQNEFYGLLRAYGQTEARAISMAGTTELQNIINSQFQDLTDPISQNIKWPAQLVKEKLNNAIKNKQDNQAQIGHDLVAAAGKDAVIGVGINFVTTFAGTLFGELTNKMFKGLLGGIDAVTVNPFDPNQVGPVKSAEDLFKSLGTFEPLDTSGYSLTSELASCPASMLRNTRGVYSCAMDTSFVSVVTRGNSSPLTLKEAIDGKYINGDWPLIGPLDALNHDDSCYKRAFCHSNLLKLRKARIVPVGWEMAASISGSGKYTLKQAMDSFYDCNADGQANAEHPLCKLVDPKWILKAPESQCRTLAYGQQLQTAGGADRAQECVDIQTCVAEDANGKCLGGYGYCTRESNVWRFRGDACSEQYASCQSLVNKENKPVNYLLTTVDYGQCDPGSVGCKWVSTEKTIDDKGKFDWPVVNDAAKLLSSAAAEKEVTYVNDKATTCQSGNCRELVARAGGVTLNEISNGSFEDDVDNDRIPDGWSMPLATISDNGGISGGRALSLKPNTQRRGLILKPGYAYSLQLLAKKAAGNSNVDISLSYNVASGNLVANNANAFAANGLFGTTCFNVSDQNNAITQVNLTKTLTSADFEKVACSFTVPLLPDTIQEVQGILTINGTDGVLVDDVQLEQGAQPSAFAFGYSSEGVKTYAKLAPAYLGCTGSANDSVECAKYARVCSPLEEGCKLYTPKNGDPGVNGITGASDYCPASCVGYDTYKQEATAYEPKGLFPVNFIPATAKTCSVNAAGCDEFTNLSDSNREYYSGLRACLTSTQSSNTAVYYTWEGSDVSGYQIKTWKLLKTDMRVADVALDVKAPCTSWSSTTNGISCHDDVNTVDGVPDKVDASCNDRADIFAPDGDCREFYDTDGDIIYRKWSQTVTIDDACTTYRKTTIAGANAAEQASVCESAGGYFDAANASCFFHGLANLSKSCSASENGCRLYTGGRSNNSRQALTETFESGNLQAYDTVDTTKVTYSNESLANTGHSIKSLGAKFWAYYGNSGATCTTTTGCATTGTLGGKCTVLNGKQYCGTLDSQLFAGKTYTISLWAKGSGKFKVGFASAAPQDKTAVQITDAFVGLNGTADQTLATEWHEYRLGPLDMNALNHAGFGPGSTLVFEPIGGATLYVDNISLREGEQNIALIRDSWSTPAVCDTNSVGQYAPQFNLGCQAYTDSGKQTSYLKSFSRLCSEKSIGCAAYYDTQASNTTTGGIFGGYCKRLGTDTSGTQDCRLESNGSGAYDPASPFLCTLAIGQTSCRFNLDHYLPQSQVAGHIKFLSDTELVKPDAPVYAVVKKENVCNAAEAGCTEVGIPKLSADHSRVDSWETANLLMDPDQYGTILCQQTQLYCSEFDGGTAGKFYFKDPGGKECEYKDNVKVSGQTYSGWFVKGTTNFCYGSGKCVAGGNACTTDADCRQAKVGKCSVFGNSCAQDADCTLNERCLGTSTDTCALTTGTYITAGTESSIWRDGDAGYKGWVGLCPAEASGCREFADPLDRGDNQVYGEGVAKAYDFIDNDSLGDANVTSGERCNGQVSTEQGCVLFRDNGVPDLRYNSSASSIASEHADALFGQTPYSLVQPISCDDGEARSKITLPGGAGSVDLCAQRCVYDSHQVNDADNGGFLTAGQYMDSLTATGGTLPAGELTKAYIFGGSCALDTDCAPKISQLGNTINGSCRGAVNLKNNDNTATALVPRLVDDSNRVLKVNRDRSCSEWVTGDNCRSVWDAQLGQYRNSCSTLSLCNEYDQSGAVSCKGFKLDDPALVLTPQQYAARDVSWYGQEYSGYSVAGQFTLNKLGQENVNSNKLCTTFKLIPGTETPAPPTIACNVDADCTAEPNSKCKANPAGPDWALVYNAGACTGTYGSSCTVGYCSNNGSACTGDANCFGGKCTVGTCVIGVLDAQNKPLTCQQDRDCGTDQTCNAGLCQKNTGSVCGMDGSCSAAGVGATCRYSAATRSGSCINGGCLQKPNGTAYDVNYQGDDLLKVCRANPEKNSPFNNEIVEKWSALDNNGKVLEVKANAVDSSPQAYPFNVRAGFDQVNTCAPGQVCECSYKKVATSAGTSKYVELKGKQEEMVAAIIASRGALGQQAPKPDTTKLGICAGGPANGAFCLIDSDKKEWGCRDERGSTTDINTVASGSFGVCNPITREDSLIGLRGYCLERDTGLNINGDPKLGACLTWYPVDELRGETDLNAKDTSAGFVQDAFYCADVKNYANIGVAMGCSAIRGSDGKANDNFAIGHDLKNYLSACKETVACPSGYFAIVGNAGSGNVATMTGPQKSCADGAAKVNDPLALNDKLWPRGSTDEQANDACPFLCVPLASVHSDDGKQCTPPTKDDGLTSSETVNNGFSTKTYYISDNNKAETVMNDYGDCTFYGYSYKDSNDATSDELGIDTFINKSNVSILRGRKSSGTDYGAEAAIYQGDLNSNCYVAGQSLGQDHYGCADFVLQSPFRKAVQYPACASIIQTGSTNVDDASAPRTNTIFTGNANSIFAKDVKPGVFGGTLSPAQVLSAAFDPTPAVIPSCLSKTGDYKYNDGTNSSPIYYAGRWSFYSFLTAKNDCSMFDTDIDQDGVADFETSPTFMNVSGLEQAWPRVALLARIAYDAAVGYGPLPPSQLLNGVPTAQSKPNIPAAQGYVTVKNDLDKIFARPISLWTWVTDKTIVPLGHYGLGHYVQDTDIASVLPEFAPTTDKWDSRSATGHAPKLYSVDFTKCDGQTCREGSENKISVNGTDTGDQTGQSGFFRANVQFFAAADKEQLPLRRVIVDWNDIPGSLVDQFGSNASDNFYKNYRGLDKNNHDQQICSEGGEWGKTAESCEAAYLSFTHTYSCSAAAISKLPVCDATMSNLPCYSTNGVGEQECVYQPRVHVRDNWGFCSGVCTSNAVQGGSNPSSCFANVGGLEMPGPSASECNYELYPTESSDVNPRDGLPDVNPWIPYSGLIHIKKS